MHTAFIRNNVLHTVRTGAGSGGCEKSADEKPVLSSGEITAAGDSFRIKASRVITLEAYTTDDLQDVAADMAPGLAVAT